MKSGFVLCTIAAACWLTWTQVASADNSLPAPAQETLDTIIVDAQLWDLGNHKKIAVNDDQEVIFTASDWPGHENHWSVAVYRQGHLETIYILSPAHTDIVSMSQNGLMIPGATDSGVADLAAMLATIAANG